MSIVSGKTLLLALAVLAVLGGILLPLAGGWARAAEPEDPSIISRGTQVRGGPPPQLVLMYSGEVMGWTEPCG
jgi:hypothetical protein